VASLLVSLFFTLSVWQITNGLIYSFRMFGGPIPMRISTRLLVLQSFAFSLLLLFMLTLGVYGAKAERASWRLLWGNSDDPEADTSFKGREYASTVSELNWYIRDVTEEPENKEREYRDMKNREIEDREMDFMRRARSQTSRQSRPGTARASPDSSPTSSAKSEPVLSLCVKPKYLPAEPSQFRTNPPTNPP
jgi:hypothetical protein